MCVCVRVHVFVTIHIRVKLVEHGYIRTCLIECAWPECVHVLCVCTQMCVCKPISVLYAYS